ncbi:hypothetical protein LTR09_001172 [Extremus antarcticus]|uniref:Uncharacterized protein n=1 Tax=Extremus antarcticus TaxID=702011 RepID=A0AAJ0GIE4_9PEZI|nr:hypothetical protein LTR09_001172 [Extremus antarcticus]
MDQSLQAAVATIGPIVHFGASFPSFAASHTDKLARFMVSQLPIPHQSAPWLLVLLEPVKALIGCGTLLLLAIVPGFLYVLYPTALLLAFSSLFERLSQRLVHGLDADLNHPTSASRSQTIVNLLGAGFWLFNSVAFVGGLGLRFRPVKDAGFFGAMVGMCTCSGTLLMAMCYFVVLKRMLLIVPVRKALPAFMASWCSTPDVVEDNDATSIFEYRTSNQTICHDEDTSAAAIGDHSADDDNHSDLVSDDANDQDISDHECHTAGDITDQQLIRTRSNEDDSPDPMEKYFDRLAARKASVEDAEVEKGTNATLDKIKRVTAVGAKTSRHRHPSVWYVRRRKLERTFKEFLRTKDSQFSLWSDVMQTVMEDIGTETYEDGRGDLIVLFRDVHEAVQGAIDAAAATVASQPTDSG